jgi:PNKP adenylyltransferase domain, ligase domain/RNA repair, ligase-Pnkp-associating, region of Hen1
MLLTLTTTHNPATDLGYLLHKNPAKLHSFELSFGKAHVFYPEAPTEELTAAGGEGMVVKPLEFVTKGRKGLAQPAAKVRGRESLRIIYGPEYTLPENLERLKSRGLGTNPDFSRG